MRLRRAVDAPARLAGLRDRGRSAPCASRRSGPARPPRAPSACPRPSGSPRRPIWTRTWPSSRPTPRLTAGEEGAGFQKHLVLGPRAVVLAPRPARLLGHLEGVPVGCRARGVRPPDPVRYAARVAARLAGGLRVRAPALAVEPRRPPLELGGALGGWASHICPRPPFGTSCRNGTRRVNGNGADSDSDSDLALAVHLSVRHRRILEGRAPDVEHRKPHVALPSHASPRDARSRRGGAKSNLCVHPSRCARSGACGGGMYV